MSFVNERIAIQNRFKTMFLDENSSVQCAWEGMDFKRPVGPWVALLIINDGRGAQVTCGPNPVERRPALVQVNIHVPSGQGTKAADLLADKIASVLKGDFIADLTTVIRCEPAALRPMGTRDGHYLAVLTIPYTVDTQQKDIPMSTATQYALIGDVDGVNTTFTIPSGAVPQADHFLLFINGLLQSVLDYDLQGRTVTMKFAPQSGDSLVAYF